MRAKMASKLAGGGQAAETSAVAWVIIALALLYTGASR
jgi:hypothetical protein